MIRLAKAVIYGFGIMIGLFLTAASLLYVIDISNMDVLRDHIPVGIGAAAAGLAVMELVYRCFGKHAESANWVLFVIVAVYSVAAGWLWIVNASSLPSGDPKSIYDIAVRAAGHDLLPVAPEGSYLSLWPFQSGIILIYEIILRCIPGADHITIQLCNLPFVLLAVVSGFFLIKRMIRSQRALTYWLLIMPFCLPYYLYINFMYGEIPSIGLILFSAWMLWEALIGKRSGWKKSLCILLCVAGAAGAVIYRKNSLIYVTACLLILGVLFLAQRKGRHLLLSALLLAACFLAGSLPQRLYEYRAGNVMGDGVPVEAYLAMGMQEGGAAPGWWNGYHSNLYIESGYNADMVKKESAKDIRLSLQKFAQNPGYAISFLYRKLVTQWCDQNYSCFFVTRHLFDGRTELAWEIYDGDWNRNMLRIMNGYQSAVYIGFLSFAICGAAAVRRTRGGGRNHLRRTRGSWWSCCCLSRLSEGFCSALSGKAAPVMSCLTW